MNRQKGIIAAGALTALLLIAALVMGFAGAGAGSAAAPAAALPATSDASASTELGSAAALQQWQAYSADLEQTVRTLQAREATYRQQLDAANQTIVQLQEQLNQPPQAPRGFFSEHESEEHEGHGFGGFDD